MVESLGQLNRKWRGALALIVACCIALATAPAALAGGANSVVHDCALDGNLGSHSIKDLQNALKKLPSDVDQYTDCRSLIRQAINKLGAGQRPGSNAPVNLNAHAQAALHKVAKRGGVSLKIGGETIEPGGAGQLPPGTSVPIFGSAFAHALPTSVWILLFATLLAALALLAPTVIKQFKWLRGRFGRR